MGIMYFTELLSLISEDYHCVRYVPGRYFHVCICYRTEDYHCVSVSHLFGLPLSRSIFVYEWPRLSVALTGQCYPVFMCNWFEVSSTYSAVHTTVPMHCSIFICPMVLTCNHGCGVVHSCGVGRCGCGMPPDCHEWFLCYLTWKYRTRKEPEA